MKRIFWTIFLIILGFFGGWLWRGAEIKSLENRMNFAADITKEFIKECPETWKKIMDSILYEE